MSSWPTECLFDLLNVFLTDHIIVHCITTVSAFTERGTWQVTFLTGTVIWTPATAPTFDKFNNCLRCWWFKTFRWRNCLIRWLLPSICSQWWHLRSWFFVPFTDYWYEVGSLDVWFQCSESWWQLFSFEILGFEQFPSRFIHCAAFAVLRVHCYHKNFKHIGHFVHVETILTELLKYEFQVMIYPPFLGYTGELSSPISTSECMKAQKSLTFALPTAEHLARMSIMRLALPLPVMKLSWP